MLSQFSQACFGKEENANEIHLPLCCTKTEMWKKKHFNIPSSKNIPGCNDLLMLRLIMRDLYRTL